MTTTPYTYIIKHLPTNTFYYGCRWAKNCNPNDLWVTYFTSSDEVAKLIKQYGKHSFIYHVHKTFDNAESCVAFEMYYLKKINAMHNNKFINKTNGNGYYNTIGKPSPHKGKSNERAKGTKMYNNGEQVGFFKEGKEPDGWVKGKLKTPWNKSKKAEDDIRIRMGSDKSGQTQRKNKVPVWNKGLTKKDHPSIMKYATTLIHVNTGKSSKKKNKKWYNNGIEKILLHQNDPIPEGFIRGTGNIKYS